MNHLPTIAQLLVLIVIACLRRVFLFFAEAPFPEVLFISLAFHAVSRFDLSNGRIRIAVSASARGAGLLALLSFCLAAYFIEEPSGVEDIGHYVGLGFRGLLLLLTAQGVTAIALGIKGWATWLVCLPFVWVSAAFRWMYRHWPRSIFRRRTPLIQALPPKPPPTLAERVSEAKQEFEATVKTIRGAGLDADEQEIALLNARQKYLRTLHGVLKHEVP